MKIVKWFALVLVFGFGLWLLGAWRAYLRFVGAK